MSDPFREALEADEAPHGPFRTGEPTAERRLERARAASFDRVQRETEHAIRAQRAKSQRAYRGILVVTVLSVAVLLAVAVLTVVGVRGAAAWFCPALAVAISFGVVAWKSRVLLDLWTRRSDG
ncbi:MAG: hypothetical protein KC619_22305 [Myxococcales bacterium]|nr:hypothetical protein [Myxococcales bacterium]